MHGLMCILIRQSHSETRVFPVWYIWSEIVLWSQNKKNYIGESFHFYLVHRNPLPTLCALCVSSSSMNINSMQTTILIKDAECVDSARSSGITNNWTTPDRRRVPKLWTVTKFDKMLDKEANRVNLVAELFSIMYYWNMYLWWAWREIRCAVPRYTYAIELSVHPYCKQ